MFVHGTERCILTLKVMLFNPPFPPECHHHPPYIPLGLAYLGAVLIKADIEVVAVDAQISKLNRKQIEARISENRPDIVGVTSTTLLYKSSLNIAKIAKEACPSCVTVVGGVHTSFWDQNALQESPHLDVVVRKEGESTFLELAKKVERQEKFGDILGITYKSKNGRIHRNPDRPYIEELDELPYPAYNLFPIEKYKVLGRVEYPIQMSRGCAFNCNYCSTVRMHGRKFRVREPKRVVDEIQFLMKEYGATYVGFIDDAFTLNLDKTREFLDEMLNRRIKVDWDCQSRVDGVTRKLLNDMKRTGCLSAWFGVESGSKKILEAMGKQASLQQARSAFKLADESGIFRVANIIIGFPGETRETIEETINFVHEINPDGIGYYIATPYPGTPLWDLVMKMGWLKVTDWNKYDTAHPIFETPQLKMDELLELKEEAYRRFYIRPRYFLRMLLKRNKIAFSEVKTSVAWLLRSVGIKFERGYPDISQDSEP